MEKKLEELLKDRELVAERYGKIETDKPETKREYAIKRWVKSIDTPIREVVKEFQTRLIEEKEDLEVDFAATKKVGDKEVILRTEAGAYEYTPEGEKKLKAALRKLTKKLDKELNETVIEFEPYLVDLEVLKEEDEEIIAKLKGIFIK